MKRLYCTRSTSAMASTRELATEQSTSAKRIRLSTNVKNRQEPPKKKVEEVADLESGTEWKNDLLEAPADESFSSITNDEPLSKTIIDSLPNNVLVKIFEMLSLSARIRIERVCRRWNTVGRCYSWADVEKIDYTVVADQLFKSDSSDDEDADDEFTSIRRQRRAHCRALVSRPRLANDSLRQLLDRAGSYLKSIDLSGYRDTVDYRVLRLIAQQCPLLESVNFTGILVTNSSLLSLANGCPHLKSINFQRCFHESVVDRGLSSLLATCRELISLNLSENDRVNGRCFNELSPTIRHLELSACYELSDDAIWAIADQCPSLEILHLDCCDRLSMAALAYLFGRLTQLRVLRMNEFYVFSDAPSPQAILAMQSLNKLSHLSELYLNNNFLIDDTVVCAVARGCPCLETLDISGGNKGLTDHSLISLGRFAYRTLKRLNFNYLTRITSIGVKTLSRCSQLQTLLLHRCDRVNDAGLLEVAKHCHQLRHLDVSFCHDVSGIVVSTFCKSRQQLHLTLEGEKNEKVDGGGTSKTESAQFGGQSNGGSHKVPEGGIIIYASATAVDKNMATNEWVKLNFRDGFDYGPFIVLW